MTIANSSIPKDHGVATLEGRSSNELAQVRTDLAIQRTLMAADRTLMAWVRTSMSMSSFGFTIYKILQGFQQAGTVLASSDSPRNVALFLVGMGTLAAVAGIIEFWHTAKSLELLEHVKLPRPALTMAVVMTSAGLLMFFGVITRLL